MVRDNRHDSAYLFGAIGPARAVGSAIIMPAANAEAMNEHLTEISTQVERTCPRGQSRAPVSGRGPSPGSFGDRRYDHQSGYSLVRDGRSISEVNRQRLITVTFFTDCTAGAKREEDCEREQFI